MLYSAIYKKIYKKNTDGEGNPFQEKVKSNLELNKKELFIWKRILKHFS